MSRKSEMERRMEVLNLFSRVELELLNDLLTEELDFGLDAGDDRCLSCMELELLTNPEPIVLIRYPMVEEDHSEPGEVVFRYQDFPGNYLGFDGGYAVQCDMLDAIIATQKIGYFYWSENHYLVITPDEAEAIRGNHVENWEVEV